MDRKEDIDLEDWKYLIDSRHLSDTEKAEERDAFLKARALRFEKMSDNDVKKARLMQLKYLKPKSK